MRRQDEKFCAPIGVALVLPQQHVGPMDTIRNIELLRQSFELRHQAAVIRPDDVEIEFGEFVPDLGKGADEKIQPFLFMDAPQKQNEAAPPIPDWRRRTRFGRVAIKILSAISDDESRGVPVQEFLVSEAPFLFASEDDPARITHDPAFEQAPEDRPEAMAKHRRTLQPRIEHPMRTNEIRNVQVLKRAPTSK